MVARHDDAVSSDRLPDRRTLERLFVVYFHSRIPVARPPNRRLVPNT
jgi:hypothetical protein